MTPHVPPVPLPGERDDRLPVPLPFSPPAGPPAASAPEASPDVEARVSDRDREYAVARLRRASGEGVLDLDEFSDRVALVYAARTHAELADLAADLPPEDPVSDAGFAPVEQTTAVCSSERQGGPWRPAPVTRALAVLGTCRLDFTEAQLAPDTEVEATTVFGGVDILVPDGVKVELTGWVFAGSKHYRVRNGTGAGGDADGPRLHVRARGAFGGVTVRSRPRPVP